MQKAKLNSPRLVKARVSLNDKLKDAYDDGYRMGQKNASEIVPRPDTTQVDAIRAAAELAQANAKLTYAISRMIAGRGW